MGVFSWKSTKKGVPGLSLPKRVRSLRELPAPAEIFPAERGEQNARSPAVENGNREFPGPSVAEKRHLSLLTEDDRREALRLSVEEGLGVDEAIEEVLCRSLRRRIVGAHSVHVRWLDDRAGMVAGR